MTSDAREEPARPVGDGPTFEVLVVAFGAADAPALRLAVAARAVREVARVDRVAAYPGAPPDVDELDEGVAGGSVTR